MARKHLSPEGLLPCKAEVRSCRYGGHINDNGSFSDNATVEDMEAIVNHLAGQVTEVPGNTEGLELYFRAKTNLEAAKTQSTVLSKEFIEDVTKHQPIAHRLDPNNPNPVIVQILRERFSTEDTSDFTVEYELPALGKHEQLIPLQHELAGSIIKTKALQVGINHLSYRNQSNAKSLGNNYGLVKAFFNAPGATEGLRHRLLRVNGLTEEQQAELADQTKAGWVALASDYDTEEYGRRGFQRLVEKADAQLNTAPDDSLSPYTLYSYLEKAGSQSKVSDDTIIRTAGFFREDGHPRVSGGTAAKFVLRSLQASDLSVASRVKTVQLARKLDNQDTTLSNPEPFLEEAEGNWGEIKLPTPGGTPEQIISARNRMEATRARAEAFREAGDRSAYIDAIGKHRMAELEHNKFNIVELTTRYKESEKKATSLFSSREDRGAFAELGATYQEATREELWDRIEAAVASQNN